MKIRHAYLAVSLLSIVTFTHAIAAQPIKTSNHIDDSYILNSYSPINGYNLINSYSSSLSDSSEKSMGVIDIAPKSVDFFAYTESQIYPTKELGYSLKYIAPANTHADVFVFPVPEAIKDYSHEDRIRIMTLETFADIVEAERRGMYQNFNIIDEDLVSIDQHAQGRMYGTFIVRDTNAVTALYVTEKDDMLFKIRITQLDADYNRSTISLWDNFANRMFKFLRAHRDQV